jgi:PAS domain S-box-containing protein
MTYKSTILIVDDELFMSKTLEGLLTSPDHILAFASNGEEALVKAAELTPDLILLDVMMPAMDGFEVCRRLRADAVLAEVPVIMVTALDDRESRLRGIEVGADDFISKPIDPVELQARVRTITKLNRYRRLMVERAKFERITELAPDGIMIVNAEGRILLANPALLKMFGTINPDDVLDKNMLSFVEPEQSETCAECLRHITTDEPSYVARLETVFVRMDSDGDGPPVEIQSLNPPFTPVSYTSIGGEPFPVEVHAGLCEWDNQPAMQIIVRDITERKWAEESIKTAYASLKELNEDLRHSRDMFRILFDGLDDGLVLLDGEGLVLTVNQAMANLFGRNADEIMYEPWQEICEHTDPPFPGQLVLDTMMDGCARRSRETYVSPNGQEHVLDVQTFPLLGREQNVEKVIVHIVYTRERLLGS